MYQLCRSPNVNRPIQAATLRWAGHVQGIDKNEIPRRTLETKLEESRRVRRRKLGWIEKAGNSKMVLGYLCQKVVEENSTEIRVSSWAVVLLMMMILEYFTAQKSYRFLFIIHKALFK
jgi:hypothetical protein